MVGIDLLTTQPNEDNCLSSKKNNNNTRRAHKKTIMTQHKKKSSIRGSNKKRAKNLRYSDSEDSCDGSSDEFAEKKLNTTPISQNNNSNVNRHHIVNDNKSKKQSCEHCSMYCVHSWFYNPEQDLLDIEEQILTFGTRDQKNKTT